MKYLNSIYTPNMSGKQGNVVFSNNHYGPYSCIKRKPVDPKSVSQQNVRAGTSFVSREWEKLTPDQRSKWSEIAKKYTFEKKGIRFFHTGYIFFMKLNRNLYEIKEPIIKDFPLSSNKDPQNFSYVEVRIVNTPTGLDLFLYFDPAIKPDIKIILSATLPVRVTESYGTHKTRKIAVLDSSFVSGSSIKDFYFKKYRRFPDSNSKAFFDIRSTNINSGFSSIPFSSEVYGI